MKQLELWDSLAAAVGRKPRRRAPQPIPRLAPRAREAAVAALTTQLAHWSGKAVRIVVTDNRSTMLSVRYAPSERVWVLRLHHMFLDAPAPVRRALAAWLKQPKAKAPGSTIDEYIRGNRWRISPRDLKRDPGLPIGEFHNLETMFAQVNRRFFRNQVKADITWGRHPTTRHRRSIRLGSYSPEDNLIRIHPFLDRPTVPRYVVRFIVYHEMLHAFLGFEEMPSGRRRLHSNTFREWEMAHPDYARATEWLESGSNLARLLAGRAPIAR